ncbi:MAG: hypothetical protein IJY90_03190 [Clostridia bacterium]|nr:hypothetical protein [Clostridia bacterium]
MSKNSHDGGGRRNMQYYLDKNKVACENFAKIESEVLAHRRIPDFEYCQACFLMMESGYEALKCRFEDVCRAVRSFKNVAYEYYQDVGESAMSKAGGLLYMQAAQLRQEYMQLFAKLQEEFLKSKQAIETYKELHYAKRKTDVKMWFIHFVDFNNVITKISNEIKAFEKDKVTPLIQRLNNWVKYKTVEEEFLNKTFVQTADGWEVEEREDDYFNWM